MADMAEAVAKTRNTLLERIGLAAATATDPAVLRALAEAFAMTASAERKG